MIKTFLFRPKDKKALHTYDSRVSGEPVLVSQNIPRIHGVFKSVTHTSASTTIVSTPDPGGSIVLTDLILSTDRVNNTTVTLSFTDGTNVINIYRGNATDAPINFSIGFSGRWEGWSSARLEFITSGAVNATAAVGYYKIKEGDEFNLWDSRR